MSHSGRLTTSLRLFTFIRRRIHQLDPAYRHARTTARNPVGPGTGEGEEDAQPVRVLYMPQEKGEFLFGSGEARGLMSVV